MGIGGVCRGTVMTVPYIGIVPIRRGAVGIGGVCRGTVDARSLHGHVRIRLDTAIICGVSCGTARRPFPTGELHTPSGSQRTVERAQWCYLTTGLSERIVIRHCRGISYAERELANIREGPMVLFDHRPNRTNCPRRLAAEKTVQPELHR